MVADLGDDFVDGAQGLVGLVLGRETLRERGRKHRRHDPVPRRVQRRLAAAKMLDAAGDVAAAQQKLALLADADRVIGTEEVPLCMIDQPLDHDFGIGPVADPQKDVDRPDQGNAERERLLELLGLANGVSGRLDRTIGPAGEPEPARQRHQCNDTVVITEMPDIQPLRAGSVHHRALAELHGLVLVADQVMRHAQHPFHVQHAGGVVQLPRNAFALLAGSERAVKISDPGQVDVQSAQQP